MAKQTFTTGQVLTAAQMTSLQQTAMGGGSTTAKTTSYVLTAADAGTVVAMNAAGATTITVNTGLFSAGDTVFIQNWGAGTCTVTAGTATVTTHGSLALAQWEGGTLYFTSASAAIFFDISQTSGMTNPMTTTGDTIYSSSGSTPARLGIGSTGQVLTVAGGVPSWATPASGGGMTLLSTTTLSGAQTISITSISQSYKSLFGIIYGVTNATANGILRINPNGTAQTVSSSYDGVGGSTTVQWQISGVNYVSDRTDANNSYSFKIDNYTSGSNYKPVLWSGGYTDASAVKRGLVGGGQIYTNTAISSLDINHSQGNFSTGTVLLYGVS